MSVVNTIEDLINHNSSDGDSLDLLPFFHTNTDDEIYEITKNKKPTEYYLEPSKCKNFDEELLYFFYGRAPYKIKGTLDKIASINPITMLYELDLKNPEPCKIFPFDTGGYIDKTITLIKFVI